MPRFLLSTHNRPFSKQPFCADPIISSQNGPLLAFYQICKCLNPNTLNQDGDHGKHNVCLTFWSSSYSHQFEDSPFSLCITMAKEIIVIITRSWEKPLIPLLYCPVWSVKRSHRWSKRQHSDSKLGSIFHFTVFLISNQHHANHLTPSDLKWKPTNYWYILIGKMCFLFFLRLVLIQHF